MLDNKNIISNLSYSGAIAQLSDEVYFVLINIDIVIVQF